MSVKRSPDDDEQALRKRARRRALYVPGAGLALLGYPRWGLLMLVPPLAFMGSVLALALDPCPVGVWGLLISTGAILVSLPCEAFFIGRLRVRGDATDGRGGRFRLALGLLIAGIAVTLAVFFLHVGVFRVDGNNMAPAIQSGERVLFSSFAPLQRLRRGGLVLFKPSRRAMIEAPPERTVGRVLAMPGDEIVLDRGRLIVNDRTSVALDYIGGPLAEVDVPRSPEKPLKVPDGRYFVIDSKGRDSRVLSWVDEDNVIGTRMVLISPSRFGVSVE